ncbi:MAG: hypothetical protein IPO13_04980 [Rhodocyclaceae bacterium]|nr:hypothetical protein [Rhodocyclaceae bacterium]
MATGYTVNDGNSGNNYTVTTNTAAGTITAAALALNAVTDSKVYDATTGSSGTVAKVGLQGSDSVTSLTQSYQSKNVLGSNLSTLEVAAGYTVNDGNSGNNYTVTTNTAAGTITAATLSSTLAGIANKTYDGNATATVGVTLAGVIGQDSVSGSGSGLYDNRNVGTNKPVTVASINLSGIDATNYVATAPVNNATTGTISQLNSVAWVGGAAGNWSQASNWFGGALPDGSNVSNVSIPTGSSVAFDSGVAATTLSTISSGGQLTMAAGSLTVNGTLVTDGYIQTGGVLSVGGNMTVGSSFSKLSGTTGSLKLTGASNTIAINQATGNLVFFDDQPLKLGTITAQNGNITIDTIGHLQTFGVISAPAGSITVPPGTILLAAHSPMTIGAPVTAGGNITLLAGDTAAAGDDLIINAPVTSTGSGNIRLIAGDNLMQNANVTSNGGTIGATAETGNILMSANAVSSSSGGTITYFAPAGNLIIAKLDAGPTGNIELDAGGTVGPAPGLVGPMLTGNAASIEAGGAVVVTAAVKAIEIDTPGRITYTDTVSGVTIIGLSDEEQAAAAAAASNDNATDTLLSSTEKVSETVSDDGSTGFVTTGGTKVAQNSTGDTVGGTEGTFSDEEERAKAAAKAKAEGKEEKNPDASQLVVRTCT